ncbi:MAG TPA: type II secretion system protein [Novosphingobium sp.]
MSMHHPHRPPSHEAGFTLAELLVTLGILGLVSGLLVTLFGGMFQSIRAIGAPRGDASVVAAQRILRARMERIVPAVRLDSSDPIVDARGDAHAFNFTAPPLDRAAPDLLQRFRLVLSPAGDLMLYSASSLDDRIDLNDPSLVGWRGTRLIGDVAAIDLAYFGPDRFSRDERWQAFWIQRQQAPGLVRLRLRFVAGDRREWPDLIVRPRATINAACRIHRGTGCCEAI